MMGWASEEQEPGGNAPGSRVTIESGIDIAGYELALYPNKCMSGPYQNVDMMFSGWIA